MICQSWGLAPFALAGASQTFRFPTVQEGHELGSCATVARRKEVESSSGSDLRLCSLSRRTIRRLYQLVDVVSVPFAFYHLKLHHSVRSL